MINIGGLISIIVLILSVVVHEVAHGWMANRCGDPTARLEGRLTLNPTRHLDPIGSILIPGLLLITSAPFLFGWAKPVPFNPYNLSNPRRDEALIAIAGPASNILLAVIGAIIFRILGAAGLGSIVLVAAPLVVINLVLAVFNLIPIPPLDGSKILFSFLPPSLEHIRYTLESFGFLLIFAFIFLFSNIVGHIVFNLAELLLGAPLGLL